MIAKRFQDLDSSKTLDPIVHMPIYFFQCKFRKICPNGIAVKMVAPWSCKMNVYLFVYDNYNDSMKISNPKSALTQPAFLMRNIFQIGNSLIVDANQ